MFGITTVYKRCLVMFLWVFLACSSSVSLAQSQFMGVDELKPGMQGIAKTVVAGTAIEEFGVEIMGIMKNKGPAGDLILVRTYGDVIDRSGGIAQGMSGSPVYIDGKLVGAIAYGWSLTDHKVGMVTPIADMLKIWDLADTKNVQPVITEDSKETNTAEGTETAEAPTVPDNGQELPEAVSTQLMVSGFSPNSLAMLKDKLKPFQLEPYAVGDAPSGTEFGPLEPGSAVGVQLVRGDVSVGALGTVTYTEGDKVLAFGHPFLKKGNIGYLMTPAYIFTTVSSLENSFKVGTTADELLGMINQDRGAGIAGQVGRYPVLMPMRVTVTDTDLKSERVFGMQVVRDEQLYPPLAVATAFNAIEKTMDRTGQGTAKVRFTVSAPNMPGGELTRENMFYSPVNIGELAVGELYDLLNTLAGNQYHPVNLYDIKVDVTVEEERRTASIMEAKPSVSTAKPGETIDLTITLKPFRGSTITRVVPFTVPKDRPEGPLTLEVRGGGMIPLVQFLLRQQGLDEEMLKPQKKNKSFDEIIKDFNESDRNNDIVVEILDLGNEELAVRDKPGTLKKSAKTNPADDESVTLLSTLARARGNKVMPTAAAGTKKEDNKNKSRVATDFIIDKDTQVIVNVVAAGEKTK